MKNESRRVRDCVKATFNNFSYKTKSRNKRVTRKGYEIGGVKWGKREASILDHDCIFIGTVQLKEKFLMQGEEKLKDCP